MDKNYKQLAKELSILIGIAVIGLFILDKTTSLFKDEPNNNDKETTEIVVVPDITSPVTTTYDGIGGLEEWKEEIIIGETIDYSLLKKDIWNNRDKFVQQMKGFALEGKFLEAELEIDGEVTNDLSNFISVTVDYTSGRYHVDESGCDPAKNCLFSKENNPISINIDLMNRELFSGKYYKLWNEIQPQPNIGKASVAKILVLPFDQYGNPSSKITNMKIRYRCEVEGCKVIKCDDKKSEWQCAVDNFGLQAARNLSK